MIAMKAPKLSSLLLPILLSAAPAVFGQASSTMHPEKVVGNTVCADCHEEEFKAWKSSAHSRADSVHRDAKTRKKAEEIAKKMGLKNAAAMTSSPLCTECHFTRQKKGGSTKVISGVSCESCHGGGKDYYEVHGEKDKIGDRAERQKLSKAAGMLYPHDTFLVAENCFNCHIVRDEKLVNVGGHPARSKGFNLVSWTQGEVRHNFYTPGYKRGAENLGTVQDRKRKMLVVGMLLDLEYSLRSLSKVTESGTFRNAMGKRCNAIITGELPKVIEKLGGDSAPAELLEIQTAVKDLKLTSSKLEPIAAAADKIKGPIAAFSKSQDGSGLAGVDPLIPSSAKGEPWQP
ncbi:MAG: cytochrome c family protein [Haloferula sp.]|uniref:cytochrome c family protein n=2 Tax=Haloferula sp. TaxID=2497595 RepID=UPI00329BF324